MANERIQAILMALQNVLDTISGKQDKLTAGDNVSIDGDNKISADTRLTMTGTDGKTYKLSFSAEGEDLICAYEEVN